MPRSCARIKYLIAASTAEIHAVLCAAREVAVTAEFRRHIGVGIAHALSVCRIVHPVVPAAAINIVDVDVAVDVDVVAAPIEAAAPIAAGSPATERIAGAKGKTGGDNSGADIGGRGPVVRRIGRVRPRT